MGWELERMGVDLNSFVDEAYGVLHGVGIERELAEKLALISGCDIMDLLSLANKVRAALAPGFHACTIMNAKSGKCGENCRFCAQSGHNEAEVDVYELADVHTMVERAAAAYDTGVRSFGIVTSGTGYLECNDDFNRILEAVDRIRDKFPDMSVCASLGILRPHRSIKVGSRSVLWVRALISRP